MFNFAHWLLFFLLPVLHSVFIIIWIIIIRAARCLIFFMIFTVVFRRYCLIREIVFMLRSVYLWFLPKVLLWVEFLLWKLLKRLNSFWDTDILIFILSPSRVIKPLDLVVDNKSLFYIKYINDSYFSCSHAVLMNSDNVLFD